VIQVAEKVLSEHWLSAAAIAATQFVSVHHAPDPAVSCRSRNHLSQATVQKVKLNATDEAFECCPLLCVARVASPPPLVPSHRSQQSSGSKRKGGRNVKMPKMVDTSTLPRVALAAPLSEATLRVVAGHLLATTYDLVWSNSKKCVRVFERLGLGQVRLVHRCIGAPDV
jgi:hypothetical protein